MSPALWFATKELWSTYWREYSKGRWICADRRPLRVRRDRHPGEHRDAKPVYGQAEGGRGVRDRLAARRQQRAAHLRIDLRRGILRERFDATWDAAAVEHRAV